MQCVVGELHAMLAVSSPGWVRGNWISKLTPVLVLRPVNSRVSGPSERLPVPAGWRFASLVR